MKRILVALDDSVRAPNVLAAAMDLARRTGAAIRAYRALVIPPDFPPAAATSGDGLPRLLETRARREIGRMLAGYPDVPAEIVIAQSHSPARAILDAGTEYDADLIVIGSHGYDLVDRLLGTTAASVVNTSTRDVLVVHGRHPA
jgi:universal stress protein F